MTQSFSNLISPEPTLDYCLGRLTGEWPEGDAKISCPLPDHDDSTPSFNLWDHDENGVPQRWGCFGCGRGGHVLELIEALEGITRDEAIRRAAELAAEEADSPDIERKPPQLAALRDLNAVLQELRDRFDPSRHSTLGRYMSDKGMSGEDLLSYACEEWGWLADGRGRVVLPHWRGDGTLSGIKYRSATRKDSEPGSKYLDLYGAWRDRRHPAVVLCEGETDTLWTAWQLRGEPVDVLGLPSGSAQQIAADWVEQVSGRRLALAFDADEAGMLAAKKWVSIRHDALLARLPEGEDVLSCGIPVKELVEEAESPREDSGVVVVAGNVFNRVNANGVMPIADFAFNAVRELKTDDGPAWDVKMKDDGTEVLIRASDMHNAGSLTRWANRHGRAWLATGSVHPQGVLNFLKHESSYLPLERAVSRAGKIGRSFVGPGFCIGPDKLRYIPPLTGDAKLASRIHIEPGPWSKTSILALEQAHDQGTMAIILGWLTATLLRGERAPAPPLFVSGESGSGKTSLLQAVLGTFGFEIELNLTTTTPYGVDQVINSTVGFPVWLDEYRSGAREDSMSRLRQLIRDAYFGQPSMKGGMSQDKTELSETWTWAGIVISGEMGTHETSHNDRTVMLDLDVNGRNPDALGWLNKMDNRGLGHAFLSWLAQRPDALFKIRPYGTEGELPERFRSTLGFVQAGWDAWLQFRWEVGEQHSQPVPPDLAGLAMMRQDRDDPWLQAIRACEGVLTRESQPVVQLTEDGIILIPAEVIIEAKRVGIELPARANELVGWLRKRYEVRDTRVLNGRRAKHVIGMRL